MNNNICTNCGQAFIDNLSDETVCPICGHNSLIKLHQHEFSEIVTHNGKFHTDDVMAVALMTILAPDATIIRSREIEYISPRKGRIIIDVGGQVDTNSNLFDHHQSIIERCVDGHKVPYSSAGMIWETFGYSIISKISKLNNIWVKRGKFKEVYDTILKSIIIPIDISTTIGNGRNVGGRIITIQSIINDFSKVDTTVENFKSVCNFIKSWVENYIISTIKDSDLKDTTILDLNEAIDNNQSYVVLSTPSSWIRYINSNFEFYKILNYVIFYDSNTDGWKIQGVPASPKSRKVKVPIDKNKLINVMDKITFIHPNGYLMECKTKDDAIEIISSLQK